MRTVKQKDRSKRNVEALQMWTLLAKNMSYIRSWSTVFMFYPEKSGFQYYW